MAWEDFSEFVTHFTKPTPTRSRTEYDNHLSICGSCRLIAANPFGIARSIAPVINMQKTVCFSEVPLHCLDRIADRRSRYGIGFTKEYAKSKGAIPVWYVEKDSIQHNSINHLVDTALRSAAPADDPIWRLTPFIDVTGNYPTGTYRFEWEREWRSVGDFTFDETDVAFLIIPEELHVLACEFFRKARDEHTGPCYRCPYIDSSWGIDKVARALGTGWPHEQV
jgi:hypothetical protein